MKSYTLFALLFLAGLFSINAQSLVKGKASLEKIEKNKYIISKADGMTKTVDLSSDQSKIPGILAVLFEDCNSMRDGLFKKEYFSEKTLLKTVTEYNSCDYSDYSPTDKELETANSYNNDQYKFYGGFGFGIKSVSFFQSDNEEKLNQFGLQLGVLGSPDFFGALQGNLHFDFQASLNFGGETDFTNSISPTSFSVNTYRLTLGMDYFFNKSGTIKPFLGVAIGVTGDYFEGNVNDLPFKISGGNPIWMPKAGVLYALGNGKDIGITVEYIPEYDNDLSFPNGETTIPLLVKSSHLNFGLNYYF